MSEKQSAPEIGCAYVGQYHLDQFQRDLDEMAKAGIRRIYLPMTEEDLVLRRPNLEAMSRAASAAGIEAWVFPWGVGGVFGGPRGSGFVARRLDARQIDSAGQSLAAACPNQPRFAHYMESWIHAAAETGAHGILWNEPEWARHASLPEYRGMDVSRLWTCCCEQCVSKFRALYGKPSLPPEIDNDFRSFRAGSMTAFLCELMDTAKRRRMKNGVRISVYGSPATWEGLAKGGDLEEISAAAFLPAGVSGSMDDDGRMGQFGRQTEAAWHLLESVGAGADIRRYFWLRCFQVSQDDEPLIGQVLRHLRSLGASEFGVWPFGGAASLGALACARPLEAWNAIIQSLQAPS